MATMNYKMPRQLQGIACGCIITIILLVSMRAIMGIDDAVSKSAFEIAILFATVLLSAIVSYDVVKHYG